MDAPARLAGHAVVEKGTHVEILGSQRRVRVDAVEYDGYPDAEPLLSLEEETWRQVTLGAGSAAPNTSGEASDGEKSDGEAGDALPSSATDVGGAVATGGEGSGVERG